MKWWAKAGIGIGVGAILYKLFGKVKSLQTFSAQLESEVQARVHSLNFSKLVIAIDVTLKNPTAVSISMQYPFIKIGYKIKDDKGQEQIKALATSELKNEQLIIAANTQSYIKNIQIPVSILSLGSIAPKILKRLTDKTAKIDLVVTIISTVKTDLGVFPYSDTKDISI